MATVLICDDEEVLRALVRATLDGGAHSIVEACDGEEALEQARRVQPDVILLDMMMPIKSGVDVLAELRGDPALAEIPVIMLTARTQAADREAAALLGATRFLPKPFRPSELAASVDELVSARAADAA